MGEMEEEPRRALKMRMALLGVLLVALTTTYLFILRHFDVFGLPSEGRFGALGAIEPAGEVYLEPISVDPVNDALHFRASLSPGLANRRLNLLVTHDQSSEDIKLGATDRLAVSTFQVDLTEGAVSSYPLDAYRARFGVQLRDDETSVKLPVRITLWEGTLGYKFHTTSQPGVDPDAVELTTTITRSGAFAAAGGDVDRRPCRNDFRAARIPQRAARIAPARRPCGLVAVPVDRACRRIGPGASRLQMGENGPGLLSERQRRSQD